MRTLDIPQAASIACFLSVLAALERGAQDQALPAVLALSEQDGDEDLAVASRALLLASFDAGVRALLELRGGEGASALPVLRTC